ADALIEKLKPRVESLKIGPSTDKDAEMGPVVTKMHRDKILGYIDAGEKEGAKLVVDGRGFKLQGYENGYYVGGTLFDNVEPHMSIYKDEIFGPVLSVVRRESFQDAVDLIHGHEYANGTAILPVMATRPVSSLTRSKWAWWASTCRSRCQWPITPSAAGSARCLAITPSMDPRASTSIRGSKPS